MGLWICKRNKNILDLMSSNLISHFDLNPSLLFQIRQYLQKQWRNNRIGFLNIARLSQTSMVFTKSNMLLKYVIKKRNQTKEAPSYHFLFQTFQRPDLHKSTANIAYSLCQHLEQAVSIFNAIQKPGNLLVTSDHKNVVSGATFPNMEYAITSINQ